jgi:hypothetical protein
MLFTKELESVFSKIESPVNAEDACKKRRAALFEFASKLREKYGKKGIDVNLKQGNDEYPINQFMIFYCSWIRSLASLSDNYNNFELLATCHDALVYCDIAGYIDRLYPNSNQEIRQKEIRCIKAE